MTNSAISSLASLVVVALYARRELRASTRVAGRLWIRPAILVAITVLLAVFGLIEAPHHAVALLPWIAGGIAVGAVTGVALLRFTTIRAAADRPNAVIVQGSLVTIAVWLVVILLRLGARYLFGGTSEISNLDAGVGTLAVVATASSVLASAFHRAIVARAVSP